MWSLIWKEIEGFLTSSAPSDGAIYNAKCWVISNVSQPTLEIAWMCGIHSHKPISMYTAEDLI